MSSRRSMRGRVCAFKPRDVTNTSRARERSCENVTRIANGPGIRRGEVREKFFR